MAIKCASQRAVFEYEVIQILLREKSQETKFPNIDTLHKFFRSQLVAIGLTLYVHCP